MVQTLPEPVDPPDTPPSSPAVDSGAPGVTATDILHSARCLNCAAFFYFDDAHGTYVSDWQKTGRTATCPNCAKPVWVPALPPPH